VQPGYATAKVDVRGAVVRDQRLLLVRERSDGRWSMPGGWADVGEVPSEMVAREVREESGFDVVAERVVGVYDANRDGDPLEFYHAYKIVFLCRIVGGEARASDETSEVGFFELDALPDLSTARTNERHVADLRIHLADPTTPAMFD
jgi:ADP-ribose pyrophosphatase YjhB (NUDIX family)